MNKASEVLRKAQVELQKTVFTKAETIGSDIAYCAVGALIAYALGTFDVHTILNTRDGPFLLEHYGLTGGDIEKITWWNDVNEYTFGEIADILERQGK